MANMLDQVLNDLRLTRDELVELISSKKDNFGNARLDIQGFYIQLFAAPKNGYHYCITTRNNYNIFF